MGFDIASHWCGRCGNHVFTASTEEQFVTAYRLHQEAHAVMDAMTPDQLSAILAKVGYDPLPNE